MHQLLRFAPSVEACTASLVIFLLGSDIGWVMRSKINVFNRYTSINQHVHSAQKQIIIIVAEGQYITTMSSSHSMLCGIANNQCYLPERRIEVFFPS